MLWWGWFLTGVGTGIVVATIVAWMLLRYWEKGAAKTMLNTPWWRFK